MRMHYISKDKRVQSVDISAGKPLVEQDGYHQIPSSAVFRHRDNKDIAIAIVLQDRVVAWGSPQDISEINSLAKKIRIRSVLKKDMGVDSSWSRWIRYAIKNASGIMLLMLGAGLLILFISQGGVV